MADAAPPPPPAVPRTITFPEGAAPSTGRFERLLKGAERLASVEHPTPAGVIRSSLYRTSFKFPLVRVVEDSRDGSGEAVRSVAMVADHLLLRLAPAERLRLDRFLQRYPDVRIRRELSTGEHLLLEIPDPSAPDALALWQQRLEREGIRRAGPDFLQHATATTPNDPDYGQLWGLHNSGQSGGTPDADIDAPEAWDIATGGAIIVAVVDSGVDHRHPDLAANLWTNAAGEHGYDFYDHDADPSDPSTASERGHGHGTHVSGTIAAAGNNAGGIAGVAWRAKIMALRFINAGYGGATSDAISCIRYATDNGARIINNSWGGSGGAPGDALNQEITRARARGVLFIAAAGNEGSDNDLFPSYPANYPDDNILSIAATDRRDALASYSNFGKTRVDLAAPGSEIYSTLPNGRYGVMSGTSMAAPHASGAAALILAANPSLTYAQVRTRLLEGCDPLAALASKVASGGRLNVHRSIRDLGGPLLTLTRKNPVPTGGNGDAYPNPGERVRLDLSLANLGGRAATDTTLTARLSSAAPATLDRSVLTVGNLAANTTASLDQAFTLTLGQPTTLPATFTVTFTLATSAVTTTWTESLSLSVRQASRLAGQVTRAGSGAPLAGASVTIRGDASFDLVTGADGRYQAAAFAGSYRISAAAAGLLASETRSIAAGANTPPVDIALGTAALQLSPQELRVSVPPGQTRPFQVELRHSGDTPRSLPVQTSTRGSGPGADELYALRESEPGGPVTLLQLDPAGGGQLSSRSLTLGNNGPVRGFCATRDALWILVDDFTAAGPQRKLVPVSPTTGTVGIPQLLAAPPSKDFIGLGATPTELLLTAYDYSHGGTSLYQYSPASATLSLVGTLPALATGPVAASNARQSLYLPLDDATCRELRFPTLAQLRQWPIGSAGPVHSVAFSDSHNALFLISYSFRDPWSPPEPVFRKLHPDTGTSLTGFSPPGSIAFASIRPATTARWLTTGTSATEIPTGTTFQLPLTVSTLGMTLGQSFSAAVTVESTLLAAPLELQVRLDVVAAPDPSTWNGWFETIYQRAPAAADALADTDHDGVPTYLEFATGGDPTRAALHPGRPVHRLSDDRRRFEFTFLLRKSLSAGQVVPQASADLADWSAIPSTSITTSAADADFNRITVTLPAVAGRRFIRLHAQP